MGVENRFVKRDYGYLFELHDLEEEVKNIIKDLETKERRIKFLKNKIKEQ